MNVIPKRAAIAAGALVAAGGAVGGIATAHPGHPGDGGHRGDDPGRTAPGASPAGARGPWGSRPWSLGRASFLSTLAPVDHDPAADNGSNVTGAVWIERAGRKVNVHLVATGLDPLPHVVDIHARDAGTPTACPTAALRPVVVADGLIENAEAEQATGPARISLTSSGWASPTAGFDLSRFPSADPSGVLAYHRVVKVPKWVSRDLDGAVVVVHGEDLNANGVYDGRTTASGVPLEAELPVACGVIAREAPAWWVGWYGGWSPRS